MQGKGAFPYRCRRTGADVHQSKSGKNPGGWAVERHRAFCCAQKVRTQAQSTPPITGGYFTTDRTQSDTMETRGQWEGPGGIFGEKHRGQATRVERQAGFCRAQKVRTQAQSLPRLSNRRRLFHHWTAHSQWGDTWPMEGPGGIFGEKHRGQATRVERQAGFCRPIEGRGVDRGRWKTTVNRRQTQLMRRSCTFGTHWMH